MRFHWICFPALPDANCSALSLHCLPHLHFSSTAGVSTPKDEKICILLNSAVLGNPGDAII